jgi:hypothetical protein
MAKQLTESRYRCDNCRKWFERPDGVAYSCCVIHSPRDCCHAFEVEVTKKGWYKKVTVG